MTAPPYPYPGVPHLGPHHPPHPTGAKEVEYLEVKTRYRDQNMLSTYKIHIFAEEAVLSQLAGPVFNMYARSEIKRNNDEHCISVAKLGKLTHYAELQLFRTLSRYGFTLQSSHSSIIPRNESLNDVLSMYVFAR